VENDLVKRITTAFKGLEEETDYDIQKMELQREAKPNFDGAVLNLGSLEERLKKLE